MIGRSAILACLLLLALQASAQRQQLDDSPSPRQVYSLDLEWQTQEIMRAIQAMFTNENAAVPPLTGYLRGVDIRLDTRRFVGQEVRIFLRLPTTMPGTDSVGAMELSWENGGQFLAGSVSPGQEALLFEGIVDGPITGGVLDFRLSIGAGGTPDRFDIEPRYEIEVIS